MELECLQRVAIARLQGMDISISFGILKGNHSNGNDNNKDIILPTNKMMYKFVTIVMTYIKPARDCF